MIIIPAIDIIEGSCVRLSQGDYSSKKVYNTDPLEVAKMFEGWGIRRLHLVDLDGAKQGKITNYKVLEKISSHTSLSIDFGGGLKSDEDLKIAFDSGAEMITGGSIAVKNKEKFLSWLAQYGNNKIILGADHKQGKIAVSGWLETSEMDLESFMDSYIEKGINKVICTDISRDGMLSGPSVDLYSELMNKFGNIDLIASGGVGSVKDLEDLQQIGMKSAIVGKAIYEGRIKEKDLVNFID